MIPRRPGALDDLDDDIRDHLDRETAENIARGMTPDEAARAAKHAFGNVMLTREAVRAVRIPLWWDQFRQDASYGVRALLKAPGFASAAILTLALGIGATTAMFSVVYGVLLRPLPYPAADRLVRLWEEHPGGTTALANRWISNRTYYAWSDHPRTIDVLGAYAGHEDTVRIHDEDMRVFGADISPALLNALGARPRLGRLFTPGDAEPGANQVVLVSEALWRDRFASDPMIVGSPLSILGKPYTIVGVVAADFRFLDHDTRLLRPYTVGRVSTDPAQSQRTGAITAIGRMAPGATVAQVEAEGTATARSVPVTQSTQMLFGRGGPPIMHARPLAADMTSNVRPALFVLAAAVACVLLIACTNVANLFLARGIARQRELALRAAIGASRGRLARQLLTESLMLSMGAGGLGIALAAALIHITPMLAPTRFPRLDDVRLNAPVLIFAVVVSLLTAVVSGLAPAIRATRVNVIASLRGSDSAGSGGFHGLRARQLHDGLLVAESAFAVILLVSAALLAHSFLRLTHVDGGYTPDRVLTARVLLPQGSQPEYTNHVLEETLGRLRAVPGIVAAGAGNMMPLSGNISISTFPIATASDTPIMTRCLTYIVTPGYAEALGLRLRAGRLFDQRDPGGGPRAMMVNDEFVRQYVRTGPVVGRRFTNLYRSRDNGIITEIVGVVGAMLKEGNDRQPEPEIYFAHGTESQRMVGGFNLIVRTAGDPRAWSTTVRQVLRGADHNAILERLEPLADPLAVTVSEPRFAAAVLVSFALLAVTLASVGLYGVLSYAVSRRERELGVRAALGATRGVLVGLVLREGLTVTGIGIGLGLLGALAVTRFMQGALFGVTPFDVVSFVAAPLVLSPVAALACWIPSMRAASVDPAKALRAP